MISSPIFVASVIFIPRPFYLYNCLCQLLASWYAFNSGTLKWFLDCEKPWDVFDVIVEHEETVRGRVGQDWAY